jgi:hypothetical protein
MPTFGFSAFLKLISLNPRPQRAIIRQRLTATKKKGYDFHRSLKLLAQDYLVESVPLDKLLSKAETIKRIPERKSAKRGLQALGTWRALNPGSIFSFEPVLFESPGGYFKVQFLPNFGIQLDGKNVAVHIWNTASTELDVRMTYAALSLFPSLYTAHEMCPNDLAVLSLPKSQLYRLGEVEDHSEMGSRLIRRLENIFEEIGREGDRPPTPPKGRPTAPPPNGVR